MLFAFLPHRSHTFFHVLPFLFYFADKESLCSNSFSLCMFRYINVRTHRAVGKASAGNVLPMMVWRKALCSYTTRLPTHLRISAKHGEFCNVERFFRFMSRAFTSVPEHSHRANTPSSVCIM